MRAGPHLQFLSCCMSGKSFFIESLGCAKNQVDSERMIASLQREGWRLAAEAAAADVIVVNTCAFIDQAQEESIVVGLKLRSEYPLKTVVMAGCLPERFGVELHEQLREIDGFLGAKQHRRIGEVLNRALGGERPLIVLPEEDPEDQYERTTLLSLPGSAYVKISEGCSNRCAYCAIPAIRGDLQSRPPQMIIDEVRRLIDDGIIEINIVGQDIGSYGADRGNKELPDLLEGIAGLDGDFWIRLLYIHPDHFPDRILDTVADDKRFLPYFDIPFQHAASPVLRAMGRKGEARRYLDLLSRIRNRIPCAVVRSTFMVGYPAEGEEEFEVLRRFQQASQIDWLGVFVFSPQTDTAAYALKPRVPRAVAAERKRRLEQDQIGITEKRLDAHVGRSLEVLVEELVVGEDMALARAYLQAPDVDGLTVVRTSHRDAVDVKPGTVVPVRITRRNGFDLEAVG